jgi:hypothetical protein
MAKDYDYFKSGDFIKDVKMSQRHVKKIAKKYDISQFTASVLYNRAADYNPENEKEMMKIVHRLYTKAVRGDWDA